MAKPFIPYRTALTRRSRTMRRAGTPAERKLWYEFLRDLEEKFTRQKPLHQYIADFYCSAHKLVIELDGDTHFQAHAERYDAARTARLEAEGIRILRFTNLEVREQFEGVCTRIREALGHPRKP